jgi:hypothetical protein
MVVLDPTVPDIAPLIGAHEQERHRAYLVNAFEPLSGPVEPSELRFYDNGYRKVIFEAESGLLRRRRLIRETSVIDPEGDDIVIVGMPFSEKYDLHGEYRTLCELHEREGTVAPIPLFFYDSYASKPRVKIIGMEKVAGTTLKDYHERGRAHPDLARWQAEASRLVHARTGLIYTEPHGKNIIVDEADERVRFIDVAHFQLGTLDTLVSIWLDDWIEHHPELSSRSAQRAFIDTITNRG